MSIESNTFAPDASRTLTATPPFRIMAGRGIVDACGRVILHCDARRIMGDDGYTRDAYESEALADYNVHALSPTQADANVHAIAHILNTLHAARSTRDAFAPEVAMLRALLQRAGDFIAGFEDDETQEGVGDLLRAMDAALRPRVAPQDANAASQFSTPDCPRCACVDDGACLCAPSVAAEARELLRNAEFADGMGVIRTQDAEALERALDGTPQDAAPFACTSAAHAARELRVIVTLLRDNGDGDVPGSNDAEGVRVLGGIAAWCDAQATPQDANATRDAEHVRAFVANLRHAIREGRMVYVGGGDFRPDELRAVLRALDGAA